ncbi:hypothetical protein [Streptomyces soliscabiei]|uniref:hypothetical protein n=1 Tax=Streptomyces soliscabiei TaxID=588897 RepID=UPI0029BA6477|nr:hypothetical protein [Streptomyces sp. NY05-11A]MDX2682323.1 hypothetical protein [Streptomyces sp. NY05-11A]
MQLQQRMRGEGLVEAADESVGMVHLPSQLLHCGLDHRVQQCEIRLRVDGAVEHAPRAAGAQPRVGEWIIAHGRTQRAVARPRTSSARKPTGLLCQRVETSNTSLNGTGALSVADTYLVTRSVATLKSLTDHAPDQGLCPVDVALQVQDRLKQVAVVIPVGGDLPPTGSRRPAAATIEALRVAAEEHFDAVARSLRNLGGSMPALGHQGAAPQNLLSVEVRSSFLLELVTTCHELIEFTHRSVATSVCVRFTDGRSLRNAQKRNFIQPLCQQVTF